MRVEREGGAAAWLAGTLVGAKCAGTKTASAIGVMVLSESFFEPIVAGDQKAFLASLPLPIEALRGLPCLGSFSIVQ